MNGWGGGEGGVGVDGGGGVCVCVYVCVGRLGVGRLGADRQGQAMEAAGITRGVGVCARKHTLSAGSCCSSPTAAAAAALSIAIAARLSAAPPAPPGMLAPDSAGLPILQCQQTAGRAGRTGTGAADRQEGGGRGGRGAGRQDNGGRDVCSQGSQAQEEQPARQADMGRGGERVER